MLVLSDGEPTGNNKTKEDVCALSKSTAIPIDTIGLGDASDVSDDPDPVAIQVLRDISNCSGGSYFGLPDATGLASSFNNFGQAHVQGSVILNLRMVPIPASGTKVTGIIKVSNGDQSKPATVTFTFVTP